MKNVLAIILAVSLWAPDAIAQRRALASLKLKTAAGSTELLDNVALNAAAATRTATVSLASRWSSIRVLVFFTRGTATSVTATPECTQDGTNWAAVTGRGLTAGAGTITPLVDTRTTSVSENFTLTYDVTGCDQFRIQFGGAAAGGGDLVDVQMTVVASPPSALLKD